MGRKDSEEAGAAALLLVLLVGAAVLVPGLSTLSIGNPNDCGLLIPNSGGYSKEVSNSGIPDCCMDGGAPDTAEPFVAGIPSAAEE